ncbi:hypothetical protein PC116_g11585 [Phytophthora cactorum]|nr:hypothetical protein PC116_g11585 [Phytophthora cactorum]
MVVLASNGRVSDYRDSRSVNLSAGSIVLFEHGTPTFHLTQCLI